MKHSKTEVAVLAAAIGAILGSSGKVSLAQDVANEAAQDADEILVTGSRIQRDTGFTSPVPVTSISSAELTSYAPGNTTAEALDKLPQFFLTQTAQRGDHPQFSAGRSSLNMRGMGHQRTLVLIDGSRTVAADNSSNVNIDFVPAALIERVDVVTGGASAAYGADALAGVTNFVLDRDFEGFKASVQTGQTFEHDGQNLSFSLTGGTALGEDDRLHLTWSVEGQEIDLIRRDGSVGAERPEWMRHLGYVANPAWTPGAPASVPRQIVLPDVHSTASSPTGIINGASRRADPLSPVTTPVANFPYFRHVFTIDGSSTFRYPYGAVGCYRGDPNSPSTPCTTDTTAGGPMYELQSLGNEWGVFGDEVKRRNLFLGVERELGDGASVFARVIYGVSESNKLDWVRPPWLLSPWSATVHRDNAYLPEEIRDAMDATGATEFQLDTRGKIRGPGFTNFADSQDAVNESTTWSLAVGFEKDLFEAGNWRLRANAQRGHTEKYGGLLPEARIDRIILAMDAVEVYQDRRDVNADGVVDLIADADRGTGSIVCNVNRYNPTDEQLRLSVISVNEGGTRPAVLGTVLVPAAFAGGNADAPEALVRIPGPVSMVDNTIRDCVPFNIMGTGHTSAQAAQYLVSPKEDNGGVSQEFAEVVLSGDIAEGIGAGTFALAAGASYRKESFWQAAFPRELMPYGPPTNAPQLGIRGISGGWSSNREVHAFTDFPTLQGEFDVREVFTELDFPLLRTDKGRSLGANVAVRRSDYSLSGGITSAKLGLDIGLSQSVRLRATASRDVREPSFSERFDVLGGGATVNDPQTGQFGWFTFANSLGNAALNPEYADTVTAGIVYEPQGVAGLQVAVDYYEIDLQDQIALLPNQTIVQTCYDTRATTQTYCNFVKRDPITDLITIINNRFVNIASALVTGVDLEVLWDTEVNWLGDMAESFNIRVFAGWQNENSQTPFGAPQPVERAGTIDYPDFKALLSLAYTAGPYRVNVVGRYVPETILNMDWHTRPLQACGAAACVPDTTIESQFITNLTFGYQRELANGHSWDASLTVANLFDTSPPVIPSSPGSNLLAQRVGPNGYEYYGRQFALRFGYNF
jgi:iron complex outermembrane recepter protein